MKPETQNLEFAQNRWDTTRAGLVATTQSPDARRQMALRKPAFFDTTYCGMIAAPHRTNWFVKIDEAWARAKKKGRKEGVLFLAPRNHGKSEAAAVTLVLREVCRNRNIRILMVGENQDQIKKRLARVKALMESPVVVDDWCCDPDLGLGPFRTDTAKWTETQITVDRTIVSIDPTITAIGAGAAITGGHFDLIIFDDVESPESCSTAAKRRETRDWLTGTIWPTLERGGLLVAIGTRKHADDLYQHLKDHGAFAVIEDPAIFKWVDGKRVAYIPEHTVHTTMQDGKEMLDRIECNDPEACVLWDDPDMDPLSPLVRDLNFLLSERFSMGPAQFAREYQHEVVDDDSALVKMEWLKRAMDRGKHLALYDVPHAVDKAGESTGLPFHEPIIVQAWDMALVTDKKRAEELSRDWTVGTTWLLDKRDNSRYLLGLNRFQGVGPDELTQRIINEFRYFEDLGMRPSQVRVEKNNFGELYYTNLAGSGLPLIPHITHGANKNDAVTGVASIRSVLDLNRVVLPTKDLRSQELVAKLAEEVYLLGRTKHDDIVMSWWIGETALRTNAQTSTVVAPRKPGLTKKAADPLADLRPLTFDWSNY